VYSGYIDFGRYLFSIPAIYEEHELARWFGVFYLIYRDKTSFPCRVGKKQIKSEN
jgi:hypothetical protein